jgi:hypothetical protein
MHGLRRRPALPVCRWGNLGGDMKTGAPPWTESLTKERALEILPRAQIAIYVMVGGGFVGRSYAEQPRSAYCDVRIGKRPYKFKDIEKAQVTLIALAERAGLDADSLPPMPDFSNLGGVF